MGLAIQKQTSTGVRADGTNLFVNPYAIHKQTNILMLQVGAMKTRPEVEQLESRILGHCLFFAAQLYVRLFFATVAGSRALARKLSGQGTWAARILHFFPAPISPEREKLERNLNYPPEPPHKPFVEIPRHPVIDVWRGRRPPERERAHREKALVI